MKLQRNNFLTMEVSVKDVFSLARHNRYEELKQLISGGKFPIDSTDNMGNTLLLVACQVR